MNSRQELAVELANSVPSGCWVSYGDIGDALKYLTGTGNGRGVAVTLTALLDDVTTWHRIRDAEGRWRGHQHIDPVPEGSHQVSKDGGYIVGDPSDAYNVSLAGEGVPISTTGCAAESHRLNLVAALRDGTIVPTKAR